MKLLCITFLLIHILSVIGQDPFTLVPIPSSSVTPTVPYIPLTVLCYRVLDTKNRTCVSVCLEAFNVTTTFNASTKSPYTVTTKPLNCPVRVTGACSSPDPSGVYNQSHISLSWDTFALTLNFSSNLKQISERSINAGKDQWYLSFVAFKNGSYVYQNNSATHATFGATIGQSYKCDRTLALRMINATNVTLPDTIATVYLTNYTVQAFASPHKEFSFGDTINCVTVDTLPAYIPIIVACALAGLVLLVLVAYVIGEIFKLKKRKEEDEEEGPGFQ